MPLYQCLLSNVESLLNRTYSNPRKWFCILAILSSGWLAATSFISVGMYMTSCINFNKMRRKKTDAAEVNSCGGSWTSNEAHIFLAAGATINILIFVIMVTLVIREKLEQNVREESPPDYETLIKSETPPPPYDELSLNSQPLYVAEANEILSALSNANTCGPETNGATPPPGVLSDQTLSPFSIPSTFWFTSVANSSNLRRPKTSSNLSRLKTSSNLSRPKTTLGNFPLFSTTSVVVSVV